jgi:hypothetical protein
MRPTGFKRAKPIHAALNKFFSIIDINSINQNWPNFIAPKIERPNDDHALIEVQKLARIVAKHYHLEDITFVVHLNSTIDAAAQVEVSDDHVIFIEYNSSKVIHFEGLWAILAHEIAHVFLGRNRCFFEDTFANEVLTDVATILLGFGACYLSAQRTFYDYRSNSVVKKSIGYISAVEMGYIAAIRARICGDDIFHVISSEVGKDAYIKGQEIFLDVGFNRPYVPRCLISQFFRQKEWFGLNDSNLIVFKCMICKQGLRIPSKNRKLVVRCTNCKSSLLCYS